MHCIIELYIYGIQCTAYHGVKNFTLCCISKLLCDEHIKYSFQPWVVYSAINSSIVWALILESSAGRAWYRLLTDTDLKYMHRHDMQPRLTIVVAQYNNVKLLIRFVYLSNESKFIRMCWNRSVSFTHYPYYGLPVAFCISFIILHSL